MMYNKNTNFLSKIDIHIFRKVKLSQLLGTYYAFGGFFQHTQGTESAFTRTVL